MNWRTLSIPAIAIAIAAGLSISPLCAVEAQGSRRDSAHVAIAARGRLLGVYDETTGDPIAGADVIDVLTGDHTLTTATGTVSLSFLRAKGSVVQVRKLGYEPWQSVVDPADTTSVTVVLKHAVAELPTVLSTAKPDISKDAGSRDGFERRCEAANVSCLRDDVIASHPSSTLGDLIIKTSGTMVARGGMLAMHSTVGGYCTPNYFVDGHEWNIKAMGGPPIDQPGAAPGGPPVTSPRSTSPPFSASDIAKIEVYPADAVRPLRFTGDQTCGTIAIWTK
jgi:hypothetical protein